jgi:hypothetical protein
MSCSVSIPAVVAHNRFVDAVPIEHLITVLCRFTTLPYCNMTCRHSQHALSLHEYMIFPVMQMSSNESGCPLLMTLNIPILDGVCHGILNIQYATIATWQHQNL